MTAFEFLGGSPTAIACVTSRGQTWTYAQIDAATARGAQALQAQGVGPGVPVAVRVREPLGFLISALSVWRAGGVVVPLDPLAHPSKTQSLLPRVRAKGIVNTVSDDGLPVWEDGPGGAALDARVGLVLFTSGSSGPPKAVLLRREGVLANVDAILEYLPVKASPRTAVVLPFLYSYALVGQALTTLRAGGTVVLLNDVAFPPLQVAALRDLNAQGLSAVPTSLRRLAQVAMELPATERPRLAYVASAGAALDSATLALVREAFPGARLFNQYGLTEASPRVSGTDDSVPEFLKGSSGRPLRNVEVAIRDSEGRDVGPGQEGDIWVRGPSVMMGYLDDPEGTARVLRADGWLKTGDHGHLGEGGYLFVKGRSDGVVKCAGVRVSLDEVGEVLRRATSPHDVCVVAVPDDLWGSRLVAFIEGPEEAVARAKAVARELHAAAKPSRYVALEHFPRTANGKPQLKELQAMAQAL